MRVAFGARSLAAPLTGVGQYAWQLALHLSRIPDLELHLFHGSAFEREVRVRGSARDAHVRQAVRRFVPFAYEIDRWRGQRGFTRGARTIGFDLYHEPSYLAYDFDGPLVLTVHDLSWIRYPQTHPAERVRALHKYFEPALRRAARVLTVSEFVKREVVEVFGIDAARIDAIPNGLDAAFRPMRADQTQPVLARYGLSHGAYLLSVGTLEPRKNLERTVRAYASLPPDVRDRHPLVVVGAMGWRTQSIERVLAPLVDRGEVKVTGYLPREDLATLTAGAAAMAYPSLYEGFGLPPLEGMGCGVPAIAANVSSLPEVVGDTGLLVDPLDVDEIAHAMRTLLEDPGLRDSLAARSLERARTFTWQACAQRTHAAYRAALASCA